MSDFLLAMWPVLAIMFCYAALSVSVQFAVHPARRRMVQLSNELSADKRASDADRNKLNDMLDLSMSWKVAVLAPVAIVGAIADAILTKEEKRSRHWLDNDPRTARFALYFGISIMAANIPMALITIPLLIVFVPVVILAEKSMASAIEKPAMRAASRLRHS